MLQQRSFTKEFIFRIAGRGMYLATQVLPSAQNGSDDDDYARTGAGSFTFSIMPSSTLQRWRSATLKS